MTGLVNGTLRFDRGRHGGFGDGPPPPTAPSSFSGFDSGASSA